MNGLQIMQETNGLWYANLFGPDGVVTAESAGHDTEQELRDWLVTSKD